MSPSLLPPRRHAVQQAQWRAQSIGGGLNLPVCEVCGHVCYPLRELCPNCLSARLPWRAVDSAGEFLAQCNIVHSNAPYFRDKLPLRIGTVKLACGPVAIAFIHDGLRVGQIIQMISRRDEGGGIVLVSVDAVAAAIVAPHAIR